MTRAQRVALRAYFDEERRVAGEFDDRAFVRDHCWEDAEGAWALSYGDVKVTPSHVEQTPFAHDTPAAVTGTMRLVRVGRDGKQRASAPRSLYFPTAHVFDWNGDGVAELAMPTDIADLAPIEIWTAVAGSPAPYAPAAGLSVRTVHDVDADGRPDLLFTSPYDGTLTVDGEVDVARLEGPESGGFWLAAHARADGTFSVDDDAAVAFAKKGCPTDGFDEPVPRDPGGMEASMRRARLTRCARLWGKPARDIDALLDKECPKKPKKKDGACPEREMLRRWVAAKPPLLLK